jgi:hypothetical protein
MLAIFLAETSSLTRLTLWCSSYYEHCCKNTQLSVEAQSVSELAMGGSFSRYYELTRLLMGAMEEERKKLVRLLRHLYSEPLLERP